MHVLVVLVNLRCISFTSETGQALLEYIDPQGFVTSDENINSQVELMSVDQQGVGHVSRDDRGVVNIDIVDIIHDIDTLALTRVCRLNDPHVLLRVMLLQLLVVRVEVAEFVWEDIGIRDKIEVSLAILLLHSDHVVAEAIFPGDLIALGEMIDLLVLIETFVDITFAATRAPQHVPLMALSVTETVVLEHGTEKFVVEAKHLIKEL